MLSFTPEKAYSIIMSTEGIKGASYLPNKDIRERSNKHLTCFIDDEMVCTANKIYNKAKSQQDSPYDDDYDPTDNYRLLHDNRYTDPTHNKALE